MNVFCTPEFKKEYEKLSKNKSYQYLGKEIIKAYFDKKMDDCLSGVRLNGHSPNPFINKRLEGSGGSRLYILLVIAKDNAYLTFVHPKSGSAGYENISDDKKAELLDNVYNCITADDLYQVTCCEKKETLIFDLLETQAEVGI
ncbi:MAG: hypothetical protein EOO99_12140 [Pedobacter sp.]|nr:MAG: hypothetical protein EOO99_12140 [Pedobacter sp.]